LKSARDENMKKNNLHAAIALSVGAVVFLLFLKMQYFYAGVITWAMICISLIIIGILDINKNRVTFENVMLVAGPSILLIGLISFFSKIYF
jgi:hypothetical protein